MFKWGIIGTGLVSRAFIVGVNGCTSSVSVISVYSKKKESSEHFARDFGIEFVADI